MKMLDGKVALVTGAGRNLGLGQAMARKLALQGAAVVISDIGKEQGKKFTTDHVGLSSEMDKIVREIVNLGGVASSLVCNVLEESEVEQAVKNTVKKFGRLDFMINNAGMNQVSLFQMTTMKKFREIFIF